MCGQFVLAYNALLTSTMRQNYLIGASGRIRTPDPLITSEMLYLLSYRSRYLLTFFI